MAARYLQAFAVGSSILVTFPFYIITYFGEAMRNFSYFKYTLLAPLYFGLLSVLMAYARATYSLNLDGWLWIVSASAVYLVSKYIGAWSLSMPSSLSRDGESRSYHSESESRSYHSESESGSYHSESESGANVHTDALYILTLLLLHYYAFSCIRLLS